MEFLRQAVERVFGPTGEAILRPVHDTHDNRSWYVELPDVRCIAKLPESHGGLTVGPAMEYELLRLTARARLAPQPLARDVPTEILFIEELGSASRLNAQQARDEDLMARVAGSLRALHSLSAPKALRIFDPAGFAEVYGGAATGGAVRRARALIYEINQLMTRCAQIVAGESLCHNDLHMGNLLLDEQLWFVDFEYAVQAAPIVDVASYAAFNALEIDAAMQLTRACAGSDQMPSAAQVQDVIRVQQILGELWEIARSDNNADS